MHFEANYHQLSLTSTLQAGSRGNSMAKHDVNAPPSLRLTITDGFSKGKVYESKALGLTITVGRSKKVRPRDLGRSRPV